MATRPAPGHPTPCKSPTAGTCGTRFDGPGGGRSLREGDESDDSEDVEGQDGDAVDAEAGVLFGGAEQQAGHVDDGEQAAEAGEVDVGGVRVGQDGFAGDEDGEQ